MEIKTRDDLLLVVSLCDMAVKEHGLQTNPRVYKLAENCRESMEKLPEIPTPMVEKKLKKKTINELNNDRL